jgi:hypothetical protein
MCEGGSIACTLHYFWTLCVIFPPRYWKVSFFHPAVGKCHFPSFFSSSLWEKHGSQVLQSRGSPALLLLDVGVLHAQVGATEQRIANLLSNNYHLLKQIKTNMAGYNIEGNTPLLREFMDNITQILHHMEMIGGQWASMPPMPIVMDTQKANWFFESQRHRPTAIVPTHVGGGSIPPVGNYSLCTLSFWIRGPSLQDAAVQPGQMCGGHVPVRFV